MNDECSNQKKFTALYCSLLYRQKKIKPWKDGFLIKHGSIIKLLDENNNLIETKHCPNREISIGDQWDFDSNLCSVEDLYLPANTSKSNMLSYPEIKRIKRAAVNEFRSPLVDRKLAQRKLFGQLETKNDVNTAETRDEVTNTCIIKDNYSTTNLVDDLDATSCGTVFKERKAGGKFTPYHPPISSKAAGVTISPEITSPPSKAFFPQVPLTKSKSEEDGDKRSADELLAMFESPDLKTESFETLSGQRTTEELLQMFSLDFEPNISTSKEVTTSPKIIKKSIPFTSEKSLDINENSKTSKTSGGKKSERKFKPFISNQSYHSIQKTSTSLNYDQKIITENIVSSPKKKSEKIIEINSEKLISSPRKNMEKLMEQNHNCPPKGTTDQMANFREKYQYSRPRLGLRNPSQSRASNSTSTSNQAPSIHKHTGEKKISDELLNINAENSAVPNNALDKSVANFTDNLIPRSSTSPNNEPFLYFPKSTERQRLTKDNLYRKTVIPPSFVTFIIILGKC